MTRLQLFLGQYINQQSSRAHTIVIFGGADADIRRDINSNFAISASIPIFLQ